MSTAAASDPRVTDVHPTMVQNWLASGETILIDVREPSEHRAEHIAGARLLPLSTFDPNQVPPADGKTIVLHCKAGARSADAARRLVAAGRTNIASMTGGLNGWKAAGLPTQIDRSAPIDVLRQTQITIGSIVLTGVLLGALVSNWFLILSGIMGAGLIVAGSTGTCGMAMAIARLPWNRAGASAAACPTPTSSTTTPA